VKLDMILNVNRELLNSIFTTTSFQIIFSIILFTEVMLEGNNV
jgi:hypothetical protein